MSNGTVRRLVQAEGKTRVLEMDDGSIVERNGGSVSWRNNNPGNLKFEYSGSADKTVKTTRTKDKALADAKRLYEGVVDLDQWGNAVFESYEAGRTAKIHLLRRNHSDRTVEDMLKSYSTVDYSGAVNHQAQADFIYSEGARQGVELRSKTIGVMTDVEIAALADGIKGFEGWRAGETHPLGEEHDLARQESQVTKTSHNRVLSEGARSPVVGELQEQLRNLGYTDVQGHPLTVDNNFGRNTRRAVEFFQRDQGLNEDGIVDPNTWAALQSATHIASIAPPTVAPVATTEASASSFPRRAPSAHIDAPAVPVLQHQSNTLGIDEHRSQAEPVTENLPLAPTELTQQFHRFMPPIYRTGNLSSASQIPPEPVAPPIHQDAASNQDTLALLQAQLHEMQRQMEAMRRQREQEREAESEREHSRPTPNEPTPHAIRSPHEAHGEPASAPHKADRLGYSDPRHPVHPLYADLKERLETQGHLLPEDRLTQITGSMHTLGFQPNWEGHAVVKNDIVYVADFSPWGFKTHVNLQEPAPSVQETLQQVDTHQQMLQQERALWEQQVQSRGHGHARSL